MHVTHLIMIKKSVDQTMRKNHTTDVVVHLDAELTYERWLALQSSLHQLIGIVSVEFQPERPHLLLVGYNPLVLNSSTILATVSNLDAGAELLGL